MPITKINDLHWLLGSYDLRSTFNQSINKSKDKTYQSLFWFNITIKQCIDVMNDSMNSIECTLKNYGLKKKIKCVKLSTKSSYFKFWYGWY